MALRGDPAVDTVTVTDTSLYELMTRESYTKRSKGPPARRGSTFVRVTCPYPWYKRWGGVGVVREWGQGEIRKWSYLVIVRRGAK